MKITKNEIIIVVALVLLGIAFRLYIIHTFPQPVMFDQDEYVTYALLIYEQPFMLASHSFRPFPYPFLMAVVYKLFGFSNHNIIYIVQAVIDTTTGLFIYIILKQSVQFKAARLLGLFVYSINPFTAAYVGVLLSEVLSAFFIIASLVSGFSFVKKPSLVRGFFFGLLTALAAQTRLAAFAWAAIPIGLSTVFIPWKRYVGVTIGLLLVFWYPLYVNWRDYKEINAATVDNFFAKELFIGAVTDRLKPFDATYPVDVQILYNEYYTETHWGRTTGERSVMAKKYFDKALDVIRTDPQAYLRKRFEKMIYLWHTDALFPYKEPGYASHRHYTFYGNIVVLIFAVIGMFSIRYEKTKWYRWLLLTTFWSLLYVTISLSFTIAEHRLTIPFYPIILCLSTIGIYEVWKNFSNRISSMR